MAQSIIPWIASYICDHDTNYGYDLSQQCQFTSFRTASEPYTQITAVVSDAAHTVPASFDVAATNSYEKPKAGEPSESLTSSLRAVEPQLALDILAWDVLGGGRDDPVFFPRAIPIGSGSASALDKSVRDILRKWWLGESKSQEDSLEAASRDANKSNPSMMRGGVAGASRASSAANGSDQSTQLIGDSRGLIPINDFLQPLLDNKKKLPSWLFASPPPDQQAQLDQIGIFGVDLFASDTEVVGVDIDSQPRSNGHASRAASAASPAPQAAPSRPPAPPTRLPTASPQAPPPRLSPSSSPAVTGRDQHTSPVASTRPQQSSSSTSHRASTPGQAQTHARASPHPSPQPLPPPAAPKHVTPPDSGSDSDDDLPIRRGAPSRPPVRAYNVFADPAVPQPSPHRSSSQPTGETDDSDLSDHERQARQRSRQHQQRTGQAEVRKASQPSPRPAPAPVEGESLSQSQDSAPLSLGRYAHSLPAPHAAQASPVSVQHPSSSAPQVPRVLVPTTEESAPVGGDEGEPESASGSGSGSGSASAAQERTPRSQATPSVKTQHTPKSQDTPATNVVRKRPRESGGTVVSVGAEADDEASVPRPEGVETRKRLKLEAGAGAEGTTEERAQPRVKAETRSTRSPEQGGYAPPAGQRTPAPDPSTSAVLSARVGVGVGARVGARGVTWDVQAASSSAAASTGQERAVEVEVTDAFVSEAGPAPESDPELKLGHRLDLGLGDFLSARYVARAHGEAVRVREARRARSEERRRSVR